MWHCAWCWGRVGISPLKITIKDLNWVRDKTRALGRPIQAGVIWKGVTEQGFVLGAVTESQGWFEGHLLNSDDLEKKDHVSRRTGQRRLSMCYFLNCL